MILPHLSIQALRHFHFLKIFLIHEASESWKQPDEVLPSSAEGKQAKVKRMTEPARRLRSGSQAPDVSPGVSPDLSRLHLCPCCPCLCSAFLACVASWHHHCFSRSCLEIFSPWSSDHPRSVWPCVSSWRAGTLSESFVSPSVSQGSCLQQVSRDDLVVKGCPAWQRFPQPRRVGSPGERGKARSAVLLGVTPELLQAEPGCPSHICIFFFYQ